jgi:TetR/AcrR family transcriptional regulator
MKTDSAQPKPQDRKRITRNPARTREKILAAALREFSDKGLSGARVDLIARRARVNKRMLYHYFGNKHDLFSAVLGHKIAQREALLSSAPENPSETLQYWFDAACRDVDWFRLLGWEALQRSDRGLVHEEQRRAISIQALGQTRRRQAKRLLPAGLDPAHLLLTMMAITAFPFTLPQAARLVTGRSVSDPKFQQAHRQFLRQFAKLLRMPPRGKGPGT